MKKTIGFIAVVLTVSLFSCSDESIPKNIKAEVEQFIEKDPHSYYSPSMPYSLDWNHKSIESLDSTIYPFLLIWKAEGREYPWKYRVIVKADTLADILKLDYFDHTWESLIPVPYNVRNEDWWSELADAEGIINLEFDNSKLELLDSIKNTWQEVFYGNVVLINETDTLWTDTIIWKPHLDKIYASKCAIKVVKDDRIEFIKGSRLIANSSFTKLEIKSILSWKDFQKLK